MAYIFWKNAEKVLAFRELMCYTTKRMISAGILRLFLCAFLRGGRRDKKPSYRAFGRMTEKRSAARNALFSETFRFRTQLRRKRETQDVKGGFLR